MVDLTTGSLVYIAGPMRGYPECNFPAFDAAEQKLQAKGYRVLSPANLDREAGFDPSKYTDKDIPDCVKRDVAAILESDAVVLLPGFEFSVGATAELALAQWLLKPIYKLQELV